MSLDLSDATVDAINAAGAAARTLGPTTSLPGVEVSEDEAANDASAPALCKVPDGIIPHTIDNEPLNIGLLFLILTFCRGHGSAGEDAFINEVFLPTLQRMPHEFVVYGPAHTPKEGNYVVEVPALDKSKSDTLFSCHLDTMHGMFSRQLRQNLEVDDTIGHVFLKKGETECLGADDGAGVWIMLEMIRFNIPGTYVFHRGEERGCIGSAWMKNNKQDFLKQFKRAVAFDRKDTQDVIHTQRGSTCCSDAFAKALAEALNKANPALTADFKPTTGVWTDTANYTGLIPECTNISVGYENAHGAQEYLNYDYLQDLLIACLVLDWSQLPTQRVPVAPSTGGYYGGRGYSSPNANLGGAYGNGVPFSRRRRGDDDWGDGWSGSFHAGMDDYDHVPPRYAGQQQQQHQHPGAHSPHNGRKGGRKGGRNSHAKWTANTPGPTVPPTPGAAGAPTSPPPGAIALNSGADIKDRAQMATDSWASRDFADMPFTELVATLDAMHGVWDGVEVANVVFGLLEEIEALNGRIDFLRKLVRA